MAPRARPPIVVEDLRPVDAGYVSLPALATYSGLSVRTLRNLLVDPMDPLQHFKLPGKILVKKSEFDTWIERRRVKTDDRPNLGAVVDDIVAGFR